MLEAGCTSTAVLHQTELQLGHLLESVLEKNLKKLFLCCTTEVYVLIVNYYVLNVDNKCWYLMCKRDGSKVTVTLLFIYLP